MFLFNGERPHLATAEQRRAVDWHGILKEEAPDVHEKEQQFIEKGGKRVDDFFTSSRGLSLGTRILVPPEDHEGEFKDCGILLCHGYTDSLRWVFVRSGFLSYAEKGLVVAGLEVEGHGLSDNVLGLVEDIDKAAVDMFEFLESVQKQYPRKKWFIHGESMGGMFAVLQALKAQETSTVQVDGMVLLSPMCKIAEDVKPAQWIVNVLLFLSNYFPSLSVIPTAMNDEFVFKNPKALELARKDPIKYVGRPRIATGATMYTATVELENKMSEVTTPFIVLHGKQDIVTPCDASIEFHEKTTKVSPEDKKLVIFEDAFHSILWGEPEKVVEECWGEIFSWIKSRCDK